MPLVSGPHNSQYTFAEGAWVRREPPLSSEARTLGEAIAQYEAAFNVSIRPCKKPLPGQTEIKYFGISGPSGEIEWLVDIHVVREGVEVCPKQDLAFALQDGDLIEMGPLAC
jgi:hypothetical protein